MRIIDQYIIKKFLVTFIMIISMFIVIAIIFDFAERIDNFMKHNAPLEAILFDYYLNFIPYFMNLFSPLIVFIAAVYFTSRMAYRTEIIAILSSGVNFYRLLVPYLVVAAMLGSVSFYLNGWVIPRGNEKLVEFESKYITGLVHTREYHIHRQLVPGLFIYMRNYNTKDQAGLKFTMEKFDGNELEYKLFSDKVSWVDSVEKWHVNKYTLRKYHEGGEELIKGEGKFLDLPIGPEDFGKKTKNIQSLNNKELSEYIELEKLRGEGLVDYYIVERYKRGSIPFSTFILVIIAYSLASRRIRGGTGLHLGLGILIAFSYILFLQFSTMFAVKANLDPILSVWIPNILFAILAFFLLRVAQK